MRHKYALVIGPDMHAGEDVDHRIAELNIPTVGDSRRTIRKDDVVSLASGLEDHAYVFVLCHAWHQDGKSGLIVTEGEIYEEGYSMLPVRRFLEYFTRPVRLVLLYCASDLAKEDMDVLSVGSICFTLSSDDKKVRRSVERDLTLIKDMKDTPEQELLSMLTYMPMGLAMHVKCEDGRVLSSVAPSAVSLEALEDVALVIEEQYAGVFSGIDKPDPEVNREHIARYMGSVMHRFLADGNVDGLDHLMLHYPDHTKRFLENSEAYLSMIMAVESGVESVIPLIDWLHRHDVDLNRKLLNGFSFLLMATQQNNAPVVEHLAGYDVDLDNCNAQGSSGLMIASWLGYDTLVEFFLSKGCDALKPNREGVDARTLAAAKGNVGVLRIMHAHAIDLYAPDAYGHFPLTLAAENTHKDSVQFLINEVGLDPAPSLFELIEKGHMGGLKLLTSLDVDLSVNREGVGLVDFAAIRGQGDMASYIQELIESKKRQTSVAPHVKDVLSHVDVAKEKPDAGQAK